MEVAASILSVKTHEERLATIEILNHSLVDYVHFDVMDGGFVPGKFLPIPELVELIKVCKKKCDVHLMVENPLEYIMAIKDMNVARVSIHVEIAKPLGPILKLLKDTSIAVFLAVDLETDISLIKPYLEEIDGVLIMAVKAGAGGQKFHPEVLMKIKELKESLKVIIDGGIDENVLPLIKALNREFILASGTFILKDLTNVKMLKNL